jgi:hypothetical protein
MKSVILFFVLCSLFLVSGCATSAPQQQAKIFDMTCPDSGCNFKNFTYYAPVQKEVHPALAILQAALPIAGQVYLGVTQTKASRDVSIATMNAFTGIFDKAGGNISYNGSFNTDQFTDSSQHNPYSFADSPVNSFNGDNRENPFTSTDRHDVNSSYNPVNNPAIVPEGF